MCSECGMNPCHASCPNEDEKPLMFCDCGAELYEDSDCWKVGNTIICESCLPDYAFIVEVD